VIQAQDFLPQKMDRVLLHHLERISYKFLFFYRKFVSFFFPVGVIIHYDIFMVKIIQIYYNDNYDVYQPIKEEIITDKVCI